jgi:cell division protein FtsL
MSMPPARPTSAVRRSQRKVVRPHGWVRAADDPSAVPRPSQPARRARAGTSLLLLVAVAALTTIGIVRVHASARVLALGAEITELTDAQARLLEEKRRLEAERAYLRHPDRIAQAAKHKLGLVPIAPERVQSIRLVEESP